MTRDTTTKRLFILAVAIGLGMASGPALAATVVIDTVTGALRHWKHLELRDHWAWQLDLIP